MANGHRASFVVKAASGLRLPIPIDDSKPFQGKSHTLNREHPHFVAPIEDHRLPEARQDQIPGNPQRARERDRAGTIKVDSVA